jgi:limonene-1,2-epoxide hydrolase
VIEQTTANARPDDLTEEERSTLTDQEQRNLRAALTECYGWGKRDKALILSVFADDAVYHDMTMEAARGIKAIDAFAGDWLGAFPEFEVTIALTVVRGDVVVFQGHFGGMNSGVVYGQPATHKRMWTPFVQIVKLRDGKIISVQDFWDKGQMVQQLGVPIDATW